MRTIPSLANSSYTKYPPGPLTFIINSSGLPIGIYTTTLTVNGGAGILDSPQVITVTLTVAQVKYLYLPIIVK